jgi:hypothetical protein
MSSAQGRFTSPDSTDGPDSVPYAKWANPQTLNLYSYGLNNPLRYVDRDGHNVSICADSSPQCYTVSDDQWAAIQKQIAAGNSGGVTTDGTGFLGTGTILCGGSACGSATYFEPSMEDPLPGIVASAMTADLGGSVLGRVGGAFARLFGRTAAGAAAAETAETVLSRMPAWVRSGGALVSWLRDLEHNGVQLSAADADAIIVKAKELNVDVRLDPPHPNTAWDVPHLNIGGKGQVHLEVPTGYDNATIPKGSAIGPGK